MLVYHIGPFQLNADRLWLTHAGKSVALGPKVVETLLALAEQAGEAVSKEALLDRVWPEGFVEEANLAQNVYVLRKTFAAFGGANPIATVPRFGYRLAVPVRLVDQGTVRAKPAGTAFARLGAVGAAIVFVAASFAVVAGYGLSERQRTRSTLSATGARLYLVGRYYWNLRTRAGVEKSLDYFARVVDADPDNALGYAALADANVTMGDYCYGTHRPGVYFARARDYANTALALDPNSAQAHATLGFIALHDDDANGATTELLRAIALAPSYGPAHEWYGIALLRSGYFTEGRKELEVASKLDPLSVATTAWLGSAAYADRRFADAIVYSRQALELAPKRVDALTTIGQAYEARGEFRMAVDAFERLANVDPFYRPQAAALLAHAYALEHRMNDARVQLAYARAHPREHDSGFAVENASHIDERSDPAT
jgi:DNA-binding winged helix-turn-helix (wHTH) protein/Tfp pilus assembly protein PilF